MKHPEPIKKHPIRPSKDSLAGYYIVKKSRIEIYSNFQDKPVFVIQRKYLDGILKELRHETPRA